MNGDFISSCYAVQGFTVKPHYFAPLLKNTAGHGDVNGKEYTCWFAIRGR